MVALFTEDQTLYFCIDDSLTASLFLVLQVYFIDVMREIDIREEVKVRDSTQFLVDPNGKIIQVKLEKECFFEEKRSYSYQPLTSLIRDEPD